MELTALFKRVIGLDIHQAQIERFVRRVRLTAAGRRALLRWEDVNT